MSHYVLQKWDGDSTLTILKEGDEAIETISTSDIIAIYQRSSDSTDPFRFVIVKLDYTKLSPEGCKGNLDSPYSVRLLSFESLPEPFLERHANETGIPSYLVSSSSHLSSKVSAGTITIITSVKSGACDASAFLNYIVRPTFDALQISKTSFYFTESERWITDYALSTIFPQANDGVAQTIVLLSGDGGIVDMINALYSSLPSPNYIKPTICLLALGTGNALANSSGLNTDSTKGLSTVFRGTPRALPTVKATFSPGSLLLTSQARDTEPLPMDSSGHGFLHGAVVVSWALHAALVADSDTVEYRKHGADRFAMAANELLEPADGSPSHRYKGRITTWHRKADGTLSKNVWDRTEHMYVLATLVSHLQAGLKISPESKPLDGVLRLADFGVLETAEEVKGVFGAAFAGGKHVEREEVGYRAIEGLRIDLLEEDARWTRVCVDGKIVRVPQNGWVEVWREERAVVDLVVDRKYS